MSLWQLLKFADKKNKMIECNLMAFYNIHFQMFYFHQMAIGFFPINLKIKSAERLKKCNKHHFYLATVLQVDIRALLFLPASKTGQNGYVQRDVQAHELKHNR